MVAPTASRAVRRVLFLRVPAEESFNVATALAGLVGSLLGGAWLVSRAPGVLAQASLALYAVSLAAVFGATALRHAVPHSELYRRLDHASIYVAILGTAAPICLLLVGGAWGWVTFALTGLLTLAGVAVKVLTPFAAPWRNLMLYLPAPLPLVGALHAATPSLAPGAVALLGGAVVSYVGGAIIDAVERPRVPRIGAHGVFHVCVLVGTALTFVFIAAWVA